MKTSESTSSTPYSSTKISIFRKKIDISSDEFKISLFKVVAGLMFIGAGVATSMVLLSAIGAAFLGLGLLTMLTNQGWGRTLFQKEECATTPQMA